MSTEYTSVYQATINCIVVATCGCVLPANMQLHEKQIAVEKECVMPLKSQGSDYIETTCLINKRINFTFLILQQNLLTLT